MSEIKSALEIALEKAEKLGKLTKEETFRLEFMPRGHNLGARYLRGEVSLEVELGKFDKEEMAFVKEGALDVLMRSISLPFHEQARKNSKKALDGILVIKKEKEKLKHIISEIEHLFTYYEQALRQLQLKFKEKVESKKGSRIGEGLGDMGNRTEMEKQIALQEEWRMAFMELNSMYERSLEDHKAKIKKLS